MIESYQEEQEMLEEQPTPINFATVAGVHNDGLSLIFDGAEAASEKHYKCNQYCKFATGQRVYLTQDSGSYVVLFPIGNPNSNVQADTATNAGSANEANKADTATKATNADYATRAGSADTAKSAETAKTATSVTTATNFTSRHTGNTVGFFGHSATARRTVSKLSTSASTAQIISKVNDLLTSLSVYGLINS